MNIKICLKTYKTKTMKCAPSIFIFVLVWTSCHCCHQNFEGYLRLGLLHPSSLLCCTQKYFSIGVKCESGNYIVRVSVSQLYNSVFNLTVNFYCACHWHIYFRSISVIAGIAGHDYLVMKFNMRWICWSFTMQVWKVKILSFPAFVGICL